VTFSTELLREGHAIDAELTAGDVIDQEVDE
jgi:hypothetical protein